MSYNTDWNGVLEVEPQMSKEDYEAYLDMICQYDWPWERLFEPLNGVDPDTMQRSLEEAIQLCFSHYGYQVNGTLEWQGDSWDDTGTIVVRNNNVNRCLGRYTGPEVLHLVPTDQLLNELKIRCAVYDDRFDETGLV